MAIPIAVLSGFLAAILAACARGRLLRISGWLLAVLSFSLTLYFLKLLVDLGSGPASRISIAWAPSLGLNFSFRADGLSLLFALLISGIGTLVVIYAGDYLKTDPHLNRFYAWLFIFMASMLGTVLSDNLILLFVFWELTSLSSFLLIGFNHEEEASRSAALQALLVTGLGGLVMLAGIVLLGATAGSFEISALLSQGAALKASPFYLPVLLLILFGAFTKSAQFPFHFWLPNAMQAPTPVSAYLHSATMVKAGIYLLARLSPLLGATTEWLYLVGGIGLATMLVGGFLSLLQTDLKRLLAYSTVSALGMIVLLLGLGSSLAVKAAMVLILAHALYKGALFLVAGAVDHESGMRDAARLGGLRKAMPVTAAAGALAALSMAGLPPTLGFIAKELFYETVLELKGWLVAAGFLAAVLTIYVGGVVGIEPFWGKPREMPKKAHEAPPGMWLGPVLLSGLGIIFGLVPQVVGSQVISHAVASSYGSSLDVKLSLWHGITPALVLSGITVLCGFGLFLARRTVRRAAQSLSWQWGPDWIYSQALKGLNGIAAWQTRLLQSGYLRIYLSVIILTTVVLVGSPLASSIPNITLPSIEARFYEVVLAVVIILATIFATRSRSRLAAVAAVGLVGTGLALIYLLYGAPDLAMIQFAIETLTVILLVLVIYKMPRFTRLTAPPERLADAFLAIAGGALMSLMVLVVTSYPQVLRQTPYYVEKSLTEAYGRNIVNVILVDFRALDTLGEITVLSASAVGVYALINLISPAVKEKIASLKRDQVVRSPMLRTSARLIMPLMLIFSIFLLLRGHNDLGGGFTGGVVASAAFMLDAIAANPATTRAKIYLKPRSLIGLGLLVALTSGVVAILSGLPFMTGLWLQESVSVLGKVGTPLIFDLGVYLVVIGVNLHILLNLMES